MSTKLRDNWKLQLLLVFAAIAYGLLAAYGWSRLWTVAATLNISESGGKPPQSKAACGRITISRRVS